MNKNEITETACKLHKVMKNKKILFLCLGNSLIPGDLFGPLVGDMLRKTRPKITVLGNTLHNITSTTLQAYLLIINKFFPKYRICVIDASLGLEQNIGCINFRNYGITPGKGVNKPLQPIGDYSITATICNFNQTNLLPFISKNFVTKLAMTTCSILHEYTILNTFVL